MGGSFKDMLGQPRPSRLETLDARVAKLLAKQFGVSELDEAGVIRPATVVAREAGLEDTILCAEVAWLASMPADMLLGATNGRTTPTFFKSSVARKFYQMLAEYQVDTAVMVFRWSGGGVMVLHNKGVPRLAPGVTMVFSEGPRTLVLTHLERYLDDLVNNR